MTQLIAAEGEILAEILETTHETWHDGLTPTAYAQFWAAQRALPWAKLHLDRWALVADSRLLASAKVYRFDATLDGRAVRLFGLGAVFTRPAHRGRGHARVLIERLLERGKAEGFDVAVLFSEIGAEYYARLGFDVVPRSIVRVEVAEPTRRGAPAMLVRAGDDRDLADIAASDRIRASACRFHLNRDRDLVHFAVARRRLLAGLGAAGARETHFYVAEEGASAVAHVFITARAGEWTIEEIGDRDPAGARAGAILQVLIAREPAERRPLIRGWLPADFTPPQIRKVSSERSAEIMMIRPLTARGTPEAPLQANEVFYWNSDTF